MASERQVPRPKALLPACGTAVNEGAGLRRAFTLTVRRCRASRVRMVELAVAAVLIVLNGVFALSELAVVSARRPRLQLLAARKRRGAKAALRLSQDPGK
ncbi:MAG: CNNM domain-containing protein, partial [Nitratireductor sp.]